jgi:hypothetical protein
VAHELFESIAPNKFVCAWSRSKYPPPSGNKSQGKEPGL